MLTKADLKAIQALIASAETSLGLKIEKLRLSNLRAHRKLLKRMDLVDTDLDKNVMESKREIERIKKYINIPALS